MLKASVFDVTAAAAVALRVTSDAAVDSDHATFIYLNRSLVFYPKHSLDVNFMKRVRNVRCMQIYRTLYIG